MERKILAGPAQAVILVGTENNDGSVFSASSGITVSDLQFTPIGNHSNGASISSAVPLVNLAGATKLLIQALSQNIRFTLDGTTPTASLGFQIRAGDPPTIIPISANTTVTVIQETATADLQYQYGS